MRGFLPDQTRVRQVHLRVRNLERTLAFYRGVLGLEAARVETATPNPQVRVSGRAGEESLLVLSEEPNAPLRAPRSLGLYHFALRYPTREALAHALGRVLQARYPIAGASDHGVSEAVYLSDPEGNGVELYADRPRPQWHWEEGEVTMVTAPLNLEELLQAGPPKPGAKAPPPPDLGHLHLHVADLRAAERFYSEFLGLTVTQRTYPGALFLAAGGYHHHLGLNTWAGKAVPPVNSVGLISYRLEVPVAEVLYCLGHRAPLLGYETRTQPQPEGEPLLQIRDPNGHWLEVQLAANAIQSAGSRCQQAEALASGR